MLLIAVPPVACALGLVVRVLAELAWPRADPVGPPTWLAFGIGLAGAILWARTRERSASEHRRGWNAVGALAVFAGAVAYPIVAVIDCNGRPCSRLLDRVDVERCAAVPYGAHVVGMDRGRGAPRGDWCTTLRDSVRNAPLGPVVAPVPCNDANVCRVVDCADVAMDRVDRCVFCDSMYGDECAIGWTSECDDVILFEGHGGPHPIHWRNWGECLARGAARCPPPPAH